MLGGTDDRGVSEVVGFILVFGMLVTAFTVYQGIVVPDQNRQVEFEHNQEVQGDLQDLRNAIVSTAATGSGRAVSVTLGATYPRRTLASNLGVSGGALQTIPTAETGIAIDHAEALNDETRDYLDTVSNGPMGPYGTKAIRYDPVYSFYSNAPETVYGNSILYNEFDATNLTVTDQVLIDGPRITLVAVAGDLSRTEQDTVSVETEPISVSSDRVAIRNTTGERVTITIPTRLPASTWEEILADEMSPEGKVEQVDPVAGADAVTIVLQQGVTYELAMAKVGVGTGASEEPAAYLTDVEGDDVSVPEGGTQKLIVEVRDRFNNPVGNVTVSATPSDGSISPTDATSGTDGRATFVYEAPDNVDTAEDVDVVVSFDGDGTANETVTFDVRVLNTDGSTDGGDGDDGGNVEEVNPGRSGTIILDDQSDIGFGGEESATLTFKNTTGQSIAITDARVSFYFDGNPGGGVFGGDDDPTEVDIYSTDQDVDASEATTLEFGDDFVPLTTQIPLNPSASDSSDTTVVDLTFDEDVEDDDFYVISLKFSNGETYTYFVSHP